MNFEDKIEEIRKKPEHIRLRWAWGLTAVCMLLVIFIWFLSIRSQREIQSEKPLFGEQQNIIDQFNMQKQSIKDTADGMKKVLESQPQPGQ
jgi:hypothetical protein